MHKLISFKNVGLSFSSKDCFHDFSTEIYPGSRIAIIGKNGSGKSSLLKILSRKLQPSSGQVMIPDDLLIGSVEQIISDYYELSGGQKLNKKLTEALALSPELLLLDEPTNHLDLANRKSLIRMLQHYQGTLVIVSHDRELLRKCTSILWHLDDNQIHQFSGSYDDYMRDIKQKRVQVEKKLSLLKNEKKATHTQSMHEQGRAAKSKAKGKKSIENKRWTKMTAGSKMMKAEKSQGKKLKAIDTQKQHLSDQLASLRLPEVIVPKFSLNSSRIVAGSVLSISNADIGYSKEKTVLKNVNLLLSFKDRVAISGKNGSGKSTLLMAILGKETVFKTGDWHLPKVEQIGYLDQHYSNLDSTVSVIDHLRKVKNNWNEQDLRRHLNDFLFRKNDEVLNIVSNLSGGEKARLSLCLIAADPPKLLILDEISNNLDLETKEHVIQVLKVYPGAMIIVSHEEDFLDEIGIDSKYEIKDCLISLV
ncbi:ABC-F family ATP-binding cassette domain-containing protein [Candidatus Babeliales bacterium]|nr:ABC-F family ATP-binding cassette domain-containing protein [Candidatus Babeliales bacterium]